MRLTLRALLAFRHGLLPPTTAAELSGLIGESPVAQELLTRLQQLSAEPADLALGDQAAADPLAADAEQLDANALAAYVDNELGPTAVADFETRCLASDALLADLAAVHQIVVQVLSEPAVLDPALRLRLQSLAGASAVDAPPLLAPPPLPVFAPLSEPVWAPSLMPVPPPLPFGPLVSIAMPLGYAPPAMQPASMLAALEPAAGLDADAPRPGLWRSMGNWLGVHARYYMHSIVVHLLLFVMVGLVAGNIQHLHRDDSAPAFDTAIDPGLNPSDSQPLELGNWQKATESQPPLALEPAAGGQAAAPLDNSQLFAAESAGQMTTVASTLGGQGRFGAASGGSASGASGALTSNQRLGWLPGGGKGAGTPGRPGRAPSSATGGGVVAAEGVGSAVDGILSTIRGELATGDLLVVWLLDASLSLYDDRQQVAARIEPFYRDLEARRGKSHQLMNAAVAFGGSTLELVAPTKFGLKMIEAVADTPIDQTGLENVMTAIDQCVHKYRKSWRGGILIVVWTDESGDDTLQLEDMIALCRQQRVVVSVVGPSSAFGSEMGVHPYVDRGTGYRFLLPIKRGPDTSFAERLLLAYWHDSTLPPWTLRGAQVGGNVPWYGGPYREGLLSGVGPYALTRLALQTGGKYTLLDHDYTRAPFKFEDMKAYLPDYGSADEYLRMLRYHPLRQAVSDVVQLSYDQQKILSLPKLSFISRRSESYPFGVHNVYMTAGEFRSALAGEFAAETAKLSIASAVLEEASARFGAAGMEKLYEREDSPRWRAWYDLTRGRLLSMSVRHVEYKLTCQLVFANAGMLNSDTNHIVFEPSQQLKSTDSEVLKRAADAKRLLQRCIDKNPDTPWAFLARWELDQPLGLSVRQTVIPAPRPGPGRPAAPVPSLPNL